MKDINIIAGVKIVRKPNPSTLQATHNAVVFSKGTKKRVVNYVQKFHISVSDAAKLFNIPVSSISRWMVEVGAGKHLANAKRAAALVSNIKVTRHGAYYDITTKESIAAAIVVAKQSVTSVAKSLNIPSSTIRQWVEHYSAGRLHEDNAVAFRRKDSAPISRQTTKAVQDRLVTKAASISKSVKDLK
jgi:transposase-like protein